HRFLLQRRDEVDEANREGRRAAEAARCRKVGLDRNVERILDAVMTEDRPHDRVLEFRRPFDALELGIAEPVFVIDDARQPQNADIDVAVDGHANDCTGAARKILRIISSAAKEADPERGARAQQHIPSNMTPQASFIQMLLYRALLTIRYPRMSSRIPNSSV